jgi:cytochrome c553
MKINLILSIACLLVAGCTGKNVASPKRAVSENVLAPVAVVPEADPKAGEAISQKGNAAGAAACIACHGATGEGQAATGFPRLANQSRMYLAQQLKSYQDGSRNNAVMMPIAKALSDTDIENVSAYFESIQSPPFAKAPNVSANVLKRGRQLAEVGDQKISLQSCENCHGPGGTGQAPAIPYIAGQYSVYLEGQLQAWKNGGRKTNHQHMGYIANSLNDKDIKTISAYFQQVPGSPGASKAPEVETSLERVKH